MIFIFMLFLWPHVGFQHMKPKVTDRIFLLYVPAWKIITNEPRTFWYCLYYEYSVKFKEMREFRMILDIFLFIYRTKIIVYFLFI